MGKFCGKCGKELNNGETFCSNCGQNVNDVYESGNFNIENRNIVTCIILSFVTCGIYGLIWFCSMVDDVNRVNNDENSTSGILVVVLSLITCGIYGLIWFYNAGKTLYDVGQRNGKNINDNSIIYLVLSIFGLSLVNYCLIQNDLNSLSNK